VLDAPAADMEGPESTDFESLSRGVEACCVMEWHSIVLTLEPSNLLSG